MDKTFVRTKLGGQNSVDKIRWTKFVGQNFCPDIRGRGRNVTGWRSFVRPSGTEDVVRVYAEAGTRRDCDELAMKVAKMVHEYTTTPTPNVFNNVL